MAASECIVTYIVALFVGSTKLPPIGQRRVDAVTSVGRDHSEGD